MPIIYITIYINIFHSTYKDLFAFLKMTKDRPASSEAFFYKYGIL